MTWTRMVADLFEELEQQAAAWALEARDLDVADLARAEYAQVDLAGRLYASLGQEIVLQTVCAGPVRGRLQRVGRGWCLVCTAGSGPQEILVGIRGVTAVGGLNDAAVPEDARGVGARLGLGAVLRRLAESGERVALWAADEVARRGIILRVGADFVELVDEDGRMLAVPLAAIVVLRVA